MLLGIPLPILAQSPGQNYVLTETMLRSDGTTKVSSVQYCDGLGRPDIYVTDGRSTNGTTAYTLTQYLFPNIVFRKWLPGVGGNTLDWKSPEDIMSLSKETNKDDSPFESYRYDVLDRPMSTIGTGQRWHKDDKKVCIMRYINRGCYEADKIARKYIVRNAGSTLSGDGIWEEGALSIKSATDEDGKTTMTFTDIADKFKKLGIWGGERHYGIYIRTALSEADLSAQSWSKILTRIAVEGGMNPEDLHNGAISVGGLKNIPLFKKTTPGYQHHILYRIKTYKQ